MNSTLTDLIRFAVRIRTQRAHLSPYLCLVALAGALPSFAATLTVTNTNDSGAGSLRNAIATASSGDTIDFNLPNPSTITLTGRGILISNNLTITGPGANELAIDGDKQNFVFGITQGAIVSISKLTIQNGADGGIQNWGTLTLTGCTVSGNSGTYGGGIANFFTGATIVNSTISGNSANSGIGSGGGILNDQGTVTLASSTVSGNSATNGGGIFSGGGTFTITNSTISGNSAPNGFGGGVVNDASTLAVTNSTISGNSAGTGGGIVNFSTLAGETGTVKSTILANNVGGNCADIYTSVSFTSDGYNLSDDSTCTSQSFTQSTDINDTPARLDPRGLQNNGGPTQTIALEPGSPAVDHIPVANCTDTNGNRVTTDQRGVSRPQGKGCDIGAYELIQTVSFETFTAHLAIDDGKHPGFVMTSTFTLGSGTSGLNPASEAMTLQIANYTLTLPAGSFHQLWKAIDAPYAYEGTVNGARLLLGIVPLGNNMFQFDAAGAPVALTGVKNPVTISLSFGNDSGSTSVNALITTY